MKNWFGDMVAKYAALSGYSKPKKSIGALKLDSNENLAIPRQLQNDLLAAARKNSDVRQYPLGGAERLIGGLSQYLRVSQSKIGIGNGSDQILDLILANFASKNTRVLTSKPTFGFFEERCKLYSLPVTGIPFSDDMTLDASKFTAKDADILYLDSPNNPTGFQFSRVQLKSIVSDFEGLVIIDEAYGEFGDYTAVPWTGKMDNLIVVRTLSKSFGLAGLRVGYFVSDRAFADVFNRVIQYPYPLSAISIEAGLAALSRADQMRQTVDVIKLERRRIIDELRRHDAFEVFDSKANFVLFDAGGADRRVYTALAEQGISVRRLGSIGRHRGCLRVTVGTKEMNSRFLLAVRDLLG